jgi:hypothetical protein
MNEKLPPGEHLITIEQLRKLNGFVMPIRPYVRKLRPLSGVGYPGWLRGSTVISGIVFPWVVSDQNNDKWDLWAFQTWEDAYTKACEIVNSKPLPIAFTPGRRSEVEQRLRQIASLVIGENQDWCTHSWSHHTSDGCTFPRCKCRRSALTIVGTMCDKSLFYAWPVS